MQRLLIYQANSTDLKQIDHQTTEVPEQPLKGKESVFFPNIKGNNVKIFT